MKTVFRICAAVGLAVGLAGGVGAQSVGIGTGVQSGTSGAIGAALAKVAADHGGLNARAVPHTSNAQHIVLVNTGELAFGLNTIGDINAVLTGEREFAGRTFPEWRAVARIVPFTASVIVRDDAGIRTADDATGKRAPSGFTAQQGLLASRKAMLDNLGIDETTLTSVPVPSSGASVEMFAAGDLDMIFSGLGGALLRRLEAETGGIRILSLRDTPEAIEAMQAAYPNTYLTQISGVPGADEPTNVLVQDMYLMSSTHVDEDVVYSLVKAIAEHQADLAAAVPILNTMDVAMMSRPLEGLVFHPGAQRYFDEMGL
ncbi:MAG: TAXI family TRAP transporter solute-binding subunit [Qingshengfaniella sp.]